MIEGGGGANAQMTPGAVAIPAVSWIYTRAVVSICGLVLPSGSKRWFELAGTFPDEKRNLLIRKMLAVASLEWIYFCDSDMVITKPDTVLQLLETGLDVVGALYYGRIDRMTSDGGEQIAAYCIEAGGFRNHKLEVNERINSAKLKGEVCEVDWIGGGALLVRRHVLEHTDAPWFFRPSAGGEDEDVQFCAKVRAAGFRIHLHTGVRVGHIQAVTKGLHEFRPQLGPE